MANSDSHQPSVGLSLPDPFRGGDFAQWLAHFELCAVANGWSDVVKARKLPTLLKDDALLIFFELPEETRLSFESLTSELKTRLNPAGAQSLAFREFERASLQPGETFRAFAARLRQLLTRANTCDGNVNVFKRLLLQRFYSALPKNRARELLIDPNVSSIETAVERLEFLSSTDAQFNMDNDAWNPNSADSIAPTVAALKQQLQDLSERVAALSVEPGNQLSAAIRRSRTNSGRRNNRRLNCWNCGQPGHIARMCPCGTTGRAPLNDQGPGGWGHHHGPKH
ncbi:hypothetical protein M513_07852 [Trichuris suis]|uniref:CCHC-type domain-containing protein n=1 Tax=Trichuris suis TaxID=68888 RepID=A0A085M206_9BILA|nr:hypothetical protein M513_07852 [Trichuris suis]